MITYTWDEIWAHNFYIFICFVHCIYTIVECSCFSQQKFHSYHPTLFFFLAAVTVCVVFCSVSVSPFCPLSSATFSTQPMKPLACMLWPCRLRTLPLQQILYHSAAFHFNLLLKCSILLHPVVIISLKWLEVQDVLRYCPPIKNTLLHRVEALISGLHVQFHYLAVDKL